MKIVIVGPGALGSLFAALLAAAPTHDVRLLDHDPERAARMNGKLLLSVDGQEFCRQVKASADVAGIGAADLLLLCVKAGDVATALVAARPLLTPDTVLISFQNGIAHLDTLAAAQLPLPPAVGVTAMGATLLAPGHVRHGGSGLTRVGFAAATDPENTERLARAVAVFRAAGMATELVDNIIDFVWDKLLVNLGINALTVLYDCPNGRLPDIAEAREQLVAAVQEGERVARALGIRLAPDPVGRTLAVCRATAVNISSMLQDVRRGRPTEIGAINGALVARAEILGIEVPVNRELVRRVRAIEAGYRRTAPRGSCPDRP
ncbi:MAG: ketopantoate reductase family protein [Thermodesulfobacteriota bacterium]